MATHGRMRVVIPLEPPAHIGDDEQKGPEMRLGNCVFDHFFGLLLTSPRKPPPPQRVRNKS